MNSVKCPKCGLANFIGKVDCCSTSKGNYTKKGYFCSKCLIEFDDDCVRVYTKDGDWMENIAINS